MATAVCWEAFGGSLKSDKIRTFILLVNSIYWFFNLDEDEESSMTDSEGEQELIDAIRQTDPEFARLAEQHTELDKKNSADGNARPLDGRGSNGNQATEEMEAEGQR